MGERSIIVKGMFKRDFWALFVIYSMLSLITLLTTSGKLCYLLTGEPFNTITG